MGNIGVGMAKKLFREALATEITMRTYDPAMDPKDLIKTSLKAQHLVEDLFDLISLDNPSNIEDFDSIVKSLATIIKEIAETMEGK